MPSDLPDTNVWVALASDRHRHHEAALKWFEGVDDNGSICFCRMTQLSFLRLMTVVEVHREDVLTNAEAIAAYGEIRSDPRVGWCDEPPRLETDWFRLAELKTPSPKRWMDAYLAAFALRADLRLVTFDRGFSQFEEHGLRALHLPT